MFYENYLTEKEKALMEENYYSIISNIDNDQALKVIEILENNSCKFINDLIVNYLEIFLINPKIIKTKLNVLKYELGNSYMDIIENNLNLLVE